MNHAASSSDDLVKRAAACYRANVQATHDLLNACDHLAQPLALATQMLHDAIGRGNRVLCCGNGGSAADAAHFAGEITGRYRLERRGFATLDLTASPALITALINDYPAEQVFARQVDAQAVAGDVLVVFTTSGNSLNVIRAIDAASRKGVPTIAFLGRDGGKCRDMADVALIVPSDVTARIQEVHQLLYHSICEALDPLLVRLADSRDNG